MTMTYEQIRTSMTARVVLRTRDGEKDGTTFQLLEIAVKAMIRQRTARQGVELNIDQWEHLVLDSVAEAWPVYVEAMLSGKLSRRDAALKAASAGFFAAWTERRKAGQPKGFLPLPHLETLVAGAVKTADVRYVRPDQDVLDAGCEAAEKHLCSNAHTVLVGVCKEMNLEQLQALLKVTDRSMRSYAAAIGRIFTRSETRNLASLSPSPSPIGLGVGNVIRDAVRSLKGGEPTAELTGKPSSLVAFPARTVVKGTPRLSPPLPVRSARERYRQGMSVRRQAARQISQADSARRNPAPHGMSDEQVMDVREAVDKSFADQRIYRLCRRMLTAIANVLR